ncbi:unnamed protein product [Clonostachys rosea f. rosea IK726]|uniref:Uncharacterized protein n=1 Tax=Clonostachys rosea f. rosea IK726 TaxID=1349383 RepID=A0ACA9U2D7_BIOOC|nr:unnamed protein product [Clonostachys rosea f. rosea IK726]
MSGLLGMYMGIELARVVVRLSAHQRPPAAFPTSLQNDVDCGTSQPPAATAWRRFYSFNS